MTDFPSRVNLDLYSPMCHGEDIWCFESLRFKLKSEQEKAVKHLWRTFGIFKSLEKNSFYHMLKITEGNPIRLN